jgi:hypothetical protein
MTAAIATSRGSIPASATYNFLRTMHVVNLAYERINEMSVLAVERENDNRIMYTAGPLRRVT